jgi:membrane protease YdiL (CAAX protease family)
MAQAELAVPAPLSAPIVRWRSTLLLVGIIGLAIAAGVAIGGEGADFASVGALYAPLIVLAALLQFRDRRAARVASWVWFWLLVLTASLLTFGAIAAAGLPAGALGTAAQSRQLAGPVGVILVILLLGVALTLTSSWAPIGRWLGARLDRSQPSHAQAVVGVLVASALAVTPLVFLQGRAPLVDLVTKVDTSTLSGGYVAQILSQVYTVAFTVVLVLVAVAWPARSSFRAALERLGVGRLSRRDVLVVCGIAVFAVGIGIGLDYLSRTVFSALGWPLTDTDIVVRLTPVAATPIGGIIVAVCAGTSEELLFRGLLQPRIGWFLANLAFASAHAFQYGADGLIGVFVLGAIQAYVRQRWNTTAAMGVHAGYDGISLLLNAFGF